MSKMLESLKELKHWKETNNENGVVWIPLFAVENMEEALNELQAIKNSNPSEALECLEDLRKQVSFANSDGCIFDDTYESIIKDIDTIKQTLLKAQEQEKVLNIIKKKCVDVWKFVNGQANWNDYTKNYEDYSIIFLTEEEFNLLEECFKK